MSSKTCRGSAESDIIAILVIFALILLVTALCAVVHENGKKSIRDDAVKAGVGEYYFESQTDTTIKFRFKTPKESTNVEH